MAEKLPKYTWSASTVTLKGTKQAVYSTLTGDLVGYVENGKFRQVAEIPQPKKDEPKQAAAPVAITTVSQASDAYNVARFAFQRAESLLNETPTTSPNYQRVLADRNAKKQAVDDSLTLYRSLSEKKTATEKETAERTKLTKKLSSNNAKLKTLQNDLQRAKDKGEDTTAIEKAITEITGNNKDVKEQLGNLGKDNRPTGVPKEAKFNTVTGNWESGTQKWDTKGQAVTEVATKDVKKPGAGKGGVVTDTGVIAQGTVDTTTPAGIAKASATPAATPVVTPTPTGTAFEKIMAEAVKLYGGIDEIFSSNEELKNLLIRAIGDPATAKDDMDEDQFVNLLQNTTWYKSNAGPIRQRGFEKRQYDALVKKIKTDDPDYKAKIDELNKTSAYGRGLQDVIELLRENATRLGRQISDDDLKVIAQGIYDYANEDDAVKIRNAILGAGSFGIGVGKDGKGITGLATGAAGQNLTTLRAVARANGMNFDTMFKDSINTWLDKIAKGESIETFKSIIRNTAKAGLPDRVGQLLDQGVDLDTIYSPYKKLMAATLELNPDSIELNDPTLRMGIGPDKEVSLYEYQRMLRKDPRWQYTNNAREDVSNSALTVLRNFGFQG